MISAEFPNWLINELNERDWSYADLAKFSGLSRGAVGNVIRGERQPGKDFLVAVAHALKLPTEAVFRAAGLLQDISLEESEWEMWRHRLQRMSPEDKERFALQVDALLEHEEKKRQLEAAAKRKKTGPLPTLPG